MLICDFSFNLQLTTLSQLVVLFQLVKSKSRLVILILIGNPKEAIRNPYI